MKGLKGLKAGEGSINMTPSLADKMYTLAQTSNHINLGTHNSLLGAPEETNLGLYVQENSKYDENITPSRVIDENVDYLRAEQLPWYDKIGAGVIKGTSLAATTFADTFLGTIAGIATAASTGKFSGLWDNPVTQGFNAWNNNLEKLLPNYYTLEETKNNENGEWYKNIFTANFIGDTLLKNTGFMVGAALSGKVVAGAAEGLMKLGEARKLYEGYSVIAQDGKKAANLAEKLKMVATGDATIDGAAIAEDAFKAAKTLRSANLKLKIIGATAGALGEARLEAVNNSTLFAEGLTQLLNQAIPQLEEDEFKKLTDESPEAFDKNGNLTQEGLNTLNQRIEQRYEDGLAKIEELRVKYGNRDFLTNLPLLTISDYILFGRSYAGGFKNASRTKNIIDDVVENGLTKSVKVVKPSILKKAWAVTKPILTEGVYEEMGQSTISNTLQQYYGAELNSFMGHLIDPNANKESISWLNAIGQGAKQEYGTMAGWQDGFVGGFMGMIGIPMRGGSVSIDKNGKATHPIVWNGSIGEVRELNEKYQEDQLLATALNERLQDPKFQEYYKANNRRISFEADKETALDNKDEFEFKNAEHSELISDAILFDKSGRIQDLYDHIDGMKNLSDEDIAGIRLDLLSDTKKELPYQNKTDKELREYFKQQAETDKTTVDNYRQIADNLAIKSGDTFKGDDLSELVWMISKVDNWEKRFHQVHEDLRTNLNPIVKQLNGGVYIDADEVESPIDEVLNQSPGDLLAALLDEGSKLAKLIDKTRSKQLDKLKTATGRVINQEVQLDNKEDKRGLPQVLGKLERLKQEVKKNESILKNSDEIISQINDLQRLSAARVSFLERYNGYIQNPERLKLDLLKVVAESKKELVKVDNAEIKDKKDIADKFTTYEEYKDFLNTNFEKEADARDFNNQMVVAGNTFAKLHKNLSSNIINFLGKVEKSPVSKEVKEGVKLAITSLMPELNAPEDLFKITSPDLELKFRELFEGTILKSTGNMLKPDETTAAMALFKELMPRVLKDYSELLDKDLIPVGKITNEGLIPTETTPEEVIETPGKDVTPVTQLTNTGSISATVKEESKTPVELNSEPNIPNSGKLKQYLYNEVPEFEVNEKTKGKFIKLKEVFPHQGPIYDYFTEHGTWDYLNAGNVKEGDTVRYMIDPEFRSKATPFKDAIFITHGPDNQVIGNIHGGKRVDEFMGLRELRDRIEKEYAETGKITETGVVGLVNGGYVELDRGNDTDLNDPKKGVDKTKLVFSIASKGLSFYFNHPHVSINKIIPPTKPGMVYMHELMGDGNYASVPLTIKTFNKEEFNRADVTTLANPMFQLIEKAVDILANTRQPEDATEGYNELSKALFLGESKKDENGLSISQNKLAIHIGLSEDKTTLIIRREDLGEDGVYRELLKADRIYLTKQDKNPNKVYPAKKLVRNDVDSIKDLIYESLYKNNILFNVDASLINSPGYNEKIYDSNILKTAMVKSGVKGVWFYLLAKTPSGTPIDFVAPSLDTNKTLYKKPTPLKPKPVVESESVIKGTEVTYKGDKYFVDNGFVVDEDNNLIMSAVKIKPIVDLAYIRDGVAGKFGPTFIQDHKINEQEWKVQDGSILNVNTLAYKTNGDVHKQNVPVEKIDELTSKSTSSSPLLDFELDLDPSLMGSFGEKATDFKNSKTNVPKNLEMSEKIPNFANLESFLKGPLMKEGFTPESFDALTQEQKEHAINCVK